MDRFKIDNFDDEFPEEDFPAHRPATKNELGAIHDGVCRYLSSPISSDGILLTKKIRSVSVVLKSVNARGKEFSLCGLLDDLIHGASCEVYVNWFHFDEVDIFNLLELDKYFEYIWYPGADDIEIFDKSFSWFLSIRHDGAVLTSGL